MSTQRFTRFAAVTATGALAAGALAASSFASSAPSHALFWENPPNKVNCGIMFHGKKPATEVLCSAAAIPAPKNTTSADGDPGFVQLGKTGKPKLLRLSQDSFASNKPAKLKKGSTWSSIGVTCKIAAKSVTCTNKSGNGFEIDGPKGYKTISKLPVSGY